MDILWIPDGFLRNPNGFLIETYESFTEYNFEISEDSMEFSRIPWNP